MSLLLNSTPGEAAVSFPAVGEGAFVRGPLLQALVQRYHGFRLGLVLAAAAVILALWCAVLGFTWAQRAAAIENARRDAVNLTFIVDEQVARTLTAIDQTMRFLDAEMRRSGQSFNLAEWARHAPVVKDFTNQVTIIGPDGRLRASSLSAHVPPVDLSDRPHFRIHLAEDAGKLYVSPPVFGRTVKRWAIRVTRRIDGPDGSFGGVLVFSLDPDYLVRLKGAPGLGTGGKVSLVGLDGVVRASSGMLLPGPDALAGPSLLGTRLFDEMSAAPSGTVTEESPFDRTRRLFAYRRVEGYPLIVLVGFSLRDVLAGTETAEHRIFLATAVATMVLATLFAYLFVEIDRRARREQELALERTKLEAANRDLLVSRDLAQAASRAKSEFLANTSHELRTPLNAIIGFSEIMRDQILGPLGNPQYAEYVLHIYESGRNLLALINDILDLSKADAGTLEMHDEHLELADLVAACVARAAAQAARANLALEIDAAGAPKAVRADEGKLRRILANLLSNAIKFTRPGGRIVVRARLEASGEATLAVEDTGIGMTPSEIATALEPFQQVDSKLARQFGGTGLGLPLTLRLVELHGGRLEIESARGRGTTVFVRLPAERVIAA
ncbi:MAG TPA: ATP-binding protein [Alphaproteobacteria bacterium]|nr:ATP-binding protein [Alphaproteobacteria bacterium]